MKDTPRTDTPRTDERKASFALDTIRQLETELTAARAEIEKYAEDKSRLATMAMEFREQRDRLAEACAGIEQAYLEGSDSEWGHAFMAVREALQSLTTNIPTSEKI